MRIAVVGLGKIGLPVAVCYAAAGHDVIGCDIDPDVVDSVTLGRVPTGIAGIDDALPAAVRAGRLSATTDTTAAVSDSECTVLLVPIGVRDGGPDYRQMDAAVASVERGLRPGHLVVFETTLAVGDTRRRYAPVLAARFALGVDLFVAFSPERVQSQRVLQDLATYPKIVGGVDAASTDRAVGFYESVLSAPVVPVASAETAELTKLAECVYRDVNIALANELARFADRSGIEIDEVIRAANSEPLSNLHQPGAGVGGHCIPVYPYFLLSRDDDLPITALARAGNDSMPGWVVGRVADRLGDLTGRRVLVLGLAYRAGVRESSGSVALALFEELRARHAVPLCLDPLFTDEEIAAHGAIPATAADLPTVDAVILQAGHSGFAELDWTALPSGTLVLDGRNTLDPERIRDAGLEYLGVGRRGGG
jgi:nucleotide sugar dehydrogenase